MKEDQRLSQIITYETGVLPQDGVCLMLRHASTQEEFDARKWAETVFAMDRKIAIGIAEALLRASGELPDKTARVKH